ncbi:hypothetical protein ACFWY9_20665 [Amycolatopsis sp. NPDC059027]|uniref:hypothetical protein n=1 Tax=unclassified Amycolatopsis TaxID=2618356 RepID=UPI00366D0CB5
MGIFDGVAHLGESVLGKVKEGGKTLAHLAGGAAGWVDDLFKGNLGTQAVPAPEVIGQVINGDSGDWFRGVGLAETLSVAQRDFTSQTSQILSGLESSWTGSASDAALARIRRFRDVAIDADVTFKGNSRSLATVGHGFTRAQTSMEPLPNRPDKSFFDVVSPWKTDTEKAIDNYNKTVDRNMAIYREYTEQTRAGSAQLSIDYGQLGAYDGGAITAAGSGGGGRKDPDQGNHHIVPPRQQNPWQQAGERTTARSSAPVPGSTSEHGRRPGAQSPGEQGIDRRQAAVPHGRDDTTTAGFVPASSRFGLPGNDSSSVVSGGGGASGVGGSSGSGFPGAAGGNGRDAPSGGSSGRPGFGTGTGKQTGSALRGATTAQGGGAGNAGTAPSGGPAGIAPGGGGRNGRGEDRERDRRFVLDDPLFAGSERPDEVDPTTGLPPVPPTIGA